MTIKEVSEKYSISADTLRYYEKIGLIPSVPRHKNGIRNYDEDSCRWIELMICMRKSGVEIEALTQYVRLFLEGSSTLDERKKLLINQQLKLVQKMNDIQESLDKLNYKIDRYEKGLVK